MFLTHKTALSHHSFFVQRRREQIGQKKKPGGKRRKVNVPPGKSITTVDLASEPSTSTATHSQDRRQQQVNYNENVEEVIYQDESDDEDWETYCQKTLAEAKEIDEDMVVQKTTVPGFKPVVKSINSYCIIIYDNIFYPGVILEMSNDTAKIKSMKKSKSYWTFPEVPDILDYS